MSDKMETWKARMQEVESQGGLSPEAATLIHAMYEELEVITKQNMNLRKTVLKATSKQTRMSSKLKDALME
ncbi:hypothetical protein PVOR_13129 [Paenibacillus vortex V453]|uniref:Uncharacterized protein n=2 Tax=Paenibacillus TaxID=44249 RepID=A0A163LD19_9BACL|nr:MULTISPECIES: hypothetical protein [Paenibacillus]AWP28470.1 hypothetical protein B9D94_18400 [Paenibacillus sp. Cedars]EFU41581.1 hypothetical protein PVOR_13129 [Paenibacillus vortex V453]KZS48009.1 hypothetical protein AWU65_19815 [Paenibacillus glucanolyticus]MDH6671788.1 hypothetical protein [Paenibacillus sp. LBL]OMF73040.1 hypothetical protein BK142_19420 [Paenibacillus glucanolyticus]